MMGTSITSENWLVAVEVEVSLRQSSLIAICSRGASASSHVPDRSVHDAKSMCRTHLRCVVMKRLAWLASNTAFSSFIERSLRNLIGRHAGSAAVTGHEVEESSEDGREVHGSASRESGHGPGSPSQLKESFSMDRKFWR